MRTFPLEIPAKPGFTFIQVVQGKNNSNAHITKHGYLFPLKQNE